MNLQMCQRWLLVLLVVVIVPEVTPRPHILWPAPQLFAPPQPNPVYISRSPQYIVNRPSFFFHRGLLNRAEPQVGPPVVQPPKGPTRLFFFSFSRFPGPLESWVQRLQNYFSTYTVPTEGEPLLVEEIDLGPDMVPPDELEPESNTSRPASSPTIVAIEVPSNPSWPEVPGMSIDSIPQESQVQGQPSELPAGGDMFIDSIPQESQVQGQPSELPAGGDMSIDSIPQESQVQGQPSELPAGGEIPKPSWPTASAPEEVTQTPGAVTEPTEANTEPTEANTEPTTLAESSN